MSHGDPPAMVIRAVEFRVPPTNVENWIAENESSFLPPVCNKLMYLGEQLSIMFVGGPNQRVDFHCEEGSELFYQLKGRMELVTMQESARRREVVPIKAGEIYLLPSRVPHSPQRFAGGIGLVIERRRASGEYDRMTWYEDFSTCARVEWEKRFVCEDLGKDLVPIVEQYKAFKSGKRAEDSSGDESEGEMLPDCPYPVPGPIRLEEYVRLTKEGKADGVLFPRPHPDGEFLVFVDKAQRSLAGVSERDEVFMLQLSGRCTIVDGGDKGQRGEVVGVLNKGECCVLGVKMEAGTAEEMRTTSESGEARQTRFVRFERDVDSVTLVVRELDFMANKLWKKMRTPANYYAAAESPPLGNDDVVPKSNSSL